MNQEASETPHHAVEAEMPLPLAYATPLDAAPSSDRMTRGDLACVALRIIGVYVAVQSLNLIDFVALDLQTVLRIAIPFVLIAGAGLSLVIFAPTIARWMLPRTAVVTSHPPGHAPAQLQAIAFSVLGVLLVVMSAPSLVYVIVMMIGSNARSSIQITPLMRLEISLPSIFQYGVECALGIWLFFGSKSLSAFWWRLRHPEFQYSDAAAEDTDSN